MRLSPSLYYRAEGSNCLLLRAENHKSKGFSEVTQNLRAMALPPPPTHGSAAVPGLEQGHSPDTQPLSWNIASSLSGWNAAPCPKFLWGKSHFLLHVHSPWALLPLSPPKPWTALPQPCMHCFIVLHITKRKTSLNAFSTHHWCLQYLLSLFFLSNWILICPVWDSHRVVCVLNAQLLAEHLPFYWTGHNQGKDPSGSRKVLQLLCSVHLHFRSKRWLMVRVGEDAPHMVFRRIWSIYKLLLCRLLPLMMCCVVSKSAFSTTES